ncbi:uncharacterized protein STEHIDRAFT_158862 [Stereum hirsutum FP-91666 SS1]|uniref:uncharacterized protein n=1 Tax=Stereum hirsutum (strain FP-91666) TaxID=721885 RepID=UPI000444A2AF|nr:uncharacterized protein STEHIDRAFT_158862 [Stereum hirsutum FP-91666 SS1]EIM85174.1 hypothetical protein STEHIDRAFT_158862 [Stereum hirsutum FP-91666 SS1]
MHRGIDAEYDVVGLNALQEIFFTQICSTVETFGSAHIFDEHVFDSFHGDMYPVEINLLAEGLPDGGRIFSLHGVRYFFRVLPEASFG